MGAGAARSELYKKEKEKKMEAYTSFAQVYDLFQDNIPDVYKRQLMIWMSMTGRESWILQTGICLFSKNFCFMVDYYHMS